MVLVLQCQDLGGLLDAGRDLLFILELALHRLDILCREVALDGLVGEDLFAKWHREDLADPWDVRRLTYPWQQDELISFRSEEMRDEQHGRERHIQVEVRRER